MADGLLVVDKPGGWTSHDVVARTRRLCGTRRVGHAGTLDPMATGVLVLGVGRATRLLTFLVGCDKAYAATVRLGQSTLTDDAEGEVTSAPGVVDPEALVARLPSAVSTLTGPIQQVPSAVSAIKVGGVRSYTRARAGDEVDLPPRPVTVSRFEVLRTTPTTVLDDEAEPLTVLDVDIEVEVSSGTYVRALARDLGAALGVGGHLIALRRTRVGRFGLDRATPLDELVAAVGQPTPAGRPTPAGQPTPTGQPTPAGQPTRAGGHERQVAGAIPLIPLAEAARTQLPVHEVSEQETHRLSHGQPIASGPGGHAAVAAIAPDGRLVAILDETRPTARSKVVFPAT